MITDAHKRLMTSATAAAFGLLAAVAASQPAQAFDLRLPASEYGKTVLSDKQSLGAAQAVADQKNVFEPMGLLREDDPLRRLTRAVGRLDLLIEDDDGRFMSSCTATIVNDGEAILTANHCIPGTEGHVVEASILLDYYGADSDTIRLNVATEPLVQDRDLDFSLVPLLDPVPRDISPVPIGRADVLPGDRLIMVHHPEALPKKLTEYGCRAAPSLAADTNLRHVCDTLPGSSGAPIFNQNLEVVGTHHSGGRTSDDPTSFNAGTRIVTILATTDLLITPADAVDPRGDQAADTAPKTAADGAAAGTDTAGTDTAGAESTDPSPIDQMIRSEGATTGATTGAATTDTNEAIEGAE